MNNEMKKQHINPENLFPSPQFGFTQVVSAQGGRTIRCSGQTAWDKNMKIVGEGDFAAQARATYENVRIALASARGGVNPIFTIHALAARTSEHLLQNWHSIIQ